MDAVVGSSKHRIARKFSSGVLVVILALVTFAWAGPSVAAESDPRFYIYYSPDCKGAGRYYQAANNGSDSSMPDSTWHKEWWINDRYNLRPYSAGYGEKIAWNGASVMVLTGTYLRVFGYNPYRSGSESSIGYYLNFKVDYDAPSRCFNLGTNYLRNNNTMFKMTEVA